MNYEKKFNSWVSNDSDNSCLNGYEFMKDKKNKFGDSYISKDKNQIRFYPCPSSKNQRAQCLRGSIIALDNNNNIWIRFVVTKDGRKGYLWFTNKKFDKKKPGRNVQWGENWLINEEKLDEYI